MHSIRDFPVLRLQSRYLVLNPVSSYRYAALVVELYGCRHADLENVTITEVLQDVEVSLPKLL